MNIHEKLRIAVIEAIYELPYEEAIEKEFYLTYSNGNVNPDPEYFKGFSITLSRVLQALKNKHIKKPDDIFSSYVSSRGFSLLGNVAGVMFDWKLLKENGETATIEDQSEETLQVLYDLLTNK